MSRFWTLPNNCSVYFWELVQFLYEAALGNAFIGICTDVLLTLIWWNQHFVGWARSFTCDGERRGCAPIDFQWLSTLFLPKELHGHIQLASTIKNERSRSKYWIQGHNSLIVHKGACKPRRISNFQIWPKWGQQHVWVRDTHGKKSDHGFYQDLLWYATAYWTKAHFS